MKKGKWIFLVLIIIGLVCCKKGPESPTGSSKITVSNAMTDTVKATWAVVSSKIESPGLKNLKDYGFCWSTKPLPDLSSYHQSFGSTSIALPFSARLSNLAALTTYFVRTYTTDDHDYVYYGPQINFTTLDLNLPVVTTNPVTNITSSSAQSGGQVTSDGNGIISARGVCWSLSGAGVPSLSNYVGLTSDTTDNYSSKITGLMADTTYQVVAYVINEKGTGYGTIRTFSTHLPCGQATVLYGNITYHSVSIGNQCWLKENLNIGTRIAGTQNQDPGNSNIQKYCFNDDSAKCTLYGGLYQWDEAMRSSIAPGAQGICPTGWHIPSDVEWTALTTFLGGDSIAGTKMKSASGWYNNGNGTNTSNFTCLPGGYRGNDSNFNNLTQLGYFWSSTQAGASQAWNRKLSYDTAQVTKYNSFKTSGFSIRCIRN